MQKLPDSSVILASNNADKHRELGAALARFGIRVRTLETPPNPEETEATFSGNAVLKAVAFARVAELPALADDSGLEVDALDGAPGVHSARYAEDADGTRSHDANNAKLLRELASLGDVPRTARFHCALALVCPPGPLADIVRNVAATEGVERPDLGDELVGVVCHGTTEGVIGEELSGEGGFGYDPLFVSDDIGVTFAQASREQKITVSHRGRAVRKLVSVLEAATRGGD